MKKILTLALAFAFSASLLFGSVANGASITSQEVVLNDSMTHYIEWGEGVKELASDPINVKVTNNEDYTIIELDKYDNNETELVTFALETPEGRVMQIQLDKATGEMTEMEAVDGSWVVNEEKSDFYTVNFTGDKYYLIVQFGFEKNFKFGIDKNFGDGVQAFYSTEMDSENYNLWFNGQNYTSSDNYVEVRTLDSLKPKFVTEGQTIGIGEELQLEFLSHYTYTISTPYAGIATVENGILTGEGQGTAEVTITTNKEGLQDDVIHITVVDFTEYELMVDNFQDSGYNYLASELVSEIELAKRNNNLDQNRLDQVLDNYKNIYNSISDESYVDSFFGEVTVGGDDTEEDVEEDTEENVEDTEEYVEESVETIEADTYEVVSGDTGTQIAERSDITFEELSELNPNVDWNSLEVGQELSITEDTVEDAEDTDNETVGNATSTATSTVSTESDKSLNWLYYILGLLGLGGIGYYIYRLRK